MRDSWTPQKWEWNKQRKWLPCVSMRSADRRELRSLGQYTYWVNSQECWRNESAAMLSAVPFKPLSEILNLSDWNTDSVYQSSMSVWRKCSWYHYQPKDCFRSFSYTKRRTILNITCTDLYTQHDSSVAHAQIFCTRIWFNGLFTANSRKRGVCIRVPECPTFFGRSTTYVKPTVSQIKKEKKKSNFQPLSVF